MKKLFLLLTVSLLLAGCAVPNSAASKRISVDDIVEEQDDEAKPAVSEGEAAAGESSFVYAFDGTYTVDVNGNIPYFTDDALKKGEESYISLSELDSLGRCGTNIASFKKSDMPTEERGEIGNIKPTGWVQAKYDIEKTESDSPYLYNRCHILAYTITGLNDEAKNLITGTRAFNLAMLNDVEVPVLEFAESHPDTHVLYRGTPVFVGDELVARGILMEAESVEDKGASLKLCKFVYNAEKEVTIDYATGKSQGPEFTGSKDDIPAPVAEIPAVKIESSYVGNKNTMKFHTGDCENAAKISDRNRVEFGDRETAVSEEYEPAGCCNP